MLKPPVLVLDAADQARAPLGTALADFARGLGQVELWGTMGWLDVQQRYRRSVMGPFWVTLSLAVFVLGLGITYGALFRMELADYLPYLTLGTVIWTLIASFLQEGCLTFTGAESAIKQMPAPLSVHVLRLVWRGLVVFAHNAIIMFVVLIAFRVNVLPGLPEAILGLLVLVLNGLGFATTLGTLSARFRDIPPLMVNIVQTLFFVTPVLWKAPDLGNRAAIATFNPLYHLIELVRAPLLGQRPPDWSWTIALGFTAANLAVALFLFARFRWRIPYWL